MAAFARVKCRFKKRSLIAYILIVHQSVRQSRPDSSVILTSFELVIEVPYAKEKDPRLFVVSVVLIRVVSVTASTMKCKHNNKNRSKRKDDGTY